MSHLSVRVIAETVAAFYGISYTDLISQRRTQIIVRPRHVAAYIARQRTKWSLPSLGRFLGGRDHTTILHSIRLIEEMIRGDADLAADVAEIGIALDALVAAATVVPINLPRDLDAAAIAAHVMEDGRAVNLSADQQRALASAVLADRPDPEPVVAAKDHIIEAGRRLVQALDAVNRAARNSDHHQRALTIRLGAVHAFRAALKTLDAAELADSNPTEESHVAHG